MSGTIVRFQDWTFEVDRAFTEQTHEKVLGSGADTCICSDCKNYVAYRDRVFPEMIINLFKELGIDYRKEVEVSHYETLPDGLRHIGGSNLKRISLGLLIRRLIKIFLNWPIPFILFTTKG